MGKSPKNPESSPEQKALQNQQLGILKEQSTTNKAFEPYYLQQLGLKKIGNEYVQMNDAERVASMSPDEKAAYTTRMLMSSRLKNALEGKSTSASLENDLTSQDKELDEYLTRKLGKDWKNTTSGVQSLDDFSSGADILRDTFARNEIVNTTGLLQNAQNQNYNNVASKIGGYQSYANRNMDMFKSLGQAVEPYENYKQLGFQHNVAKSQQKSQNIQAGVGAAATVAAIAIAI